MQAQKVYSLAIQALYERSERVSDPEAAQDCLEAIKTIETMKSIDQAIRGIKDINNCHIEIKVKRKDE